MFSKVSCSLGTNCKQMQCQVPEEGEELHCQYFIIQREQMHFSKTWWAWHICFSFLKSYLHFRNLFWINSSSKQQWNGNEIFEHWTSLGICSLWFQLGRILCCGYQRLPGMSCLGTAACLPLWNTFNVVTSTLKTKLYTFYPILFIYFWNMARNNQCFL